MSDRDALARLEGFTRGAFLLVSVLFDIVADVEAHGCVDGKSYCYLCDQQQADDE